MRQPAGRNSAVQHAVHKRSPDGTVSGPAKAVQPNPVCLNQGSKVLFLDHCSELGPPMAWRASPPTGCPATLHPLSAGCAAGWGVGAAARHIASNAARSSAAFRAAAAALPSAHIFPSVCTTGQPGEKRAYSATYWHSPLVKPCRQWRQEVGDQGSRYFNLLAPAWPSTPTALHERGSWVSEQCWT